MRIPAGLKPYLQREFRLLMTDGQWQVGWLSRRVKHGVLDFFSGGAMFNRCHWLRVDQGRDDTSLLKQGVPRRSVVSTHGLFGLAMDCSGSGATAERAEKLSTGASNSPSVKSSW